MGQYHMVVNLDKKQFLNPHGFGDGIKLMEFAGSGPYGVMTALAILLACSSGQGGRGGGDFHADQERIVGSWAGDRIAIVGDYAEAGDLLPEHHPEHIYSLCIEHGADANEARETHAAWLEERAAGYDDRDEAGELFAQAQIVRELDTFTDISPIMRALIVEGEGSYVTYTEKPWSCVRLDGTETHHVSIERDVKF